MPQNHGYDIAAVLMHLVRMVKPIAKGNGISIYFKGKPKQIHIDEDATRLIPALTDLLLKVITYTPENHQIEITIHQIIREGKCFARISLFNTGTNLSRVTELNNHVKFTVKASVSEQGGTRFEIDVPIINTEPEETLVSCTDISPIPAFYAEVRKRFVLHFIKADQLVAALSNFNPREAAFLKKVNALIVENIGNPQMDTNYISNAMHMSRTQLFRRLKPIIRQSPGGYIKVLKLQKAKELLQTTDLRINEVAFKTGFESPSHFTKAFVRHFGVKPSLFCRYKMQQMSK